MGLGLNAARREDFKDYELSKIPIPDDTNHTPTVLVPPGADDKTVLEYKKHFAEWVVTSGLAEVLEHFGLFLTVMHQHALAIYTHLTGSNSRSGASSARIGVTRASARRTTRVLRPQPRNRCS